MRLRRHIMAETSLSGFSCTGRAKARRGLWGKGKHVLFVPAPNTQAWRLLLGLRQLAEKHIP
ncbi:hypothetical protein KSD_03880 [Ktedonobacter sp. SOSP1-85]|nr:hypothetical protein KSD_03880 [Ktedonobacter sp. SOSP1-85]